MEIEQARYKYIHFVKVKEKPRTAVYECRNNRSSEDIGQVGWYGPWRQYVFEAEMGAVFNNQCLLDIASFLFNLNREHKRKARTA